MQIPEVHTQLNQQQVDDLLATMDDTMQVDLGAIPDLKAAYYDGLELYLKNCPHPAAQQSATRHTIMSLFATLNQDLPSAEDTEQLQIEHMTADFCREVLDQLTAYLPSTTPPHLQEPEMRCRSRRKVADSADK